MGQNTKNVSPMSNEGRNLYVVEHITNALLDLMKHKHINDISIGELCDKAGVGRASFYRNFNSKEDVILRELKKRLDDWWLSAIIKPDFDFTRALFEHYYEEKEICILLYHQGLAHLFLQSIKDACGPKSEQAGIDAYKSAFLAYGLYGWIEEWFKRGMKETPEEMAELLKNSEDNSIKE